MAARVLLLPYLPGATSPARHRAPGSMEGHGTRDHQRAGRRGCLGPVGHPLDLQALCSELCVSPASRTNIQRHLCVSGEGRYGHRTARSTPAAGPNHSGPVPLLSLLWATSLPQPILSAHLQSRCEQVRALTVPLPHPGSPQKLGPPFCQPHLQS